MCPQVKSRKWFSRNTWRKRMRSWCHWLDSNRWVRACTLSAHWYVFIFSSRVRLLHLFAAALDPVRSKTSSKGRSASTKASWRPRRTRRSPSLTITTPPQPPLKRLWVPSITNNNKEPAGGARTLIWMHAHTRMRKKRRSRPWPHLSNRLIHQSSVSTCLGINWNTGLSASCLTFWSGIQYL